VVLALLVGGIIIMMTTTGSMLDRLAAMMVAYQYLYLGSFGNLQSISYTLVVATALIFAGLAVSISYRAGLFNIGAAGQLTVGTITAGAIGLHFTGWPGWLLIPTMIIASGLAGAIYGGIVGFLKAWRGAHEVVTCIMLNWIAFYAADALVDGPLKAPNLSQQSLPLPPQATLPSVSNFYNQTLGTFLPQIPTPTVYTVDMSIFLAIFALIIYWFITRRTTFGYELRVIGQNVKAARYAGIPVKLNIIYAMALAGTFAGLAGSLRLMGQAPNQLIATSYALDTTGFDAIGVALLGRTTAPGVLISALLFGGLTQAGPNMQLFAHIPADLIYIMQALVLFSITIEFMPLIQRTVPALFSRSRKEPLVPNNIDETTSEIMNELIVEITEINTHAHSDGTGAPAATPIRQEE
jgi:simple sugar transport system permease protein